VSHYGLAIYIKKYLKARKNYGNSNTSPCKTISIFKKSSKRNQNPSRYNNFLSNVKFQPKPKYHLSKIFILKGGETPIKTNGQNHRTEDKREGQKRPKDKQPT
jgi:hypothetical protein